MSTILIGFAAIVIGFLVIFPPLAPDYWIARSTARVSTRVKRPN